MSIRYPSIVCVFCKISVRRVMQSSHTFSNSKNSATSVGTFSFTPSVSSPTSVAIFWLFSLRVSCCISCRIHPDLQTVVCRTPCRSPTGSGVSRLHQSSHRRYSCHVTSVILPPNILSSSSMSRMFSNVTGSVVLYVNESVMASDNSVLFLYFLRVYTQMSSQMFKKLFLGSSSGLSVLLNILYVFHTVYIF